MASTHHLRRDMNNNVVVSLFRYFRNKDLTCIRFNVRGNGESSGRRTWRGRGEREDTLSVCRFLLDEVKVQRIVIIGYSYGAAIGTSVVDELSEIVGCVAISYPFGVLTLILLGHLFEKSKTPKPKLHIMGTSDNFTSIKRFRARIAELPQPIDVTIEEGIDHFWFGEEHRLVRAIEEWLARQFLSNTPSPMPSPSATSVSPPQDESI